MAKMSTLSGVAHNIAHHSASGLSYLSPHLAIALRSANAEKTEIELLCLEPYPNNAIESKPLRLALGSLKSTIKAMIEKKHGFSQSDIVSVVLHATPAPWDETGYTLHTRSVITAKNGHIYDSGWLS